MTPRKRTYRRREWEIAVVDRNPAPWPKPAELLEHGVPLSTMAEYARLRRRMTTDLRRWLRSEWRN